MLCWFLTLTLTMAVQCRIYSTDEKLKMFTVLGGTVTVKLDYSAGVIPIPSCSSHEHLLQQPVLAGSVVTEMDHLKTYLLRLHFVDSIVTCYLVPNVKDTDTLSTSLCPRLTCPPGWDLLQDTCFLISQDLRSWAEGQSFCRLKGGSLATISSDVQQEALSRMLTQDTWIGLRHQPTINESHWDDRSAYIYSRWAHSKPQNTLDIEGCVTMSERYNFLWDTADCDDNKLFMCSVQGLPTTLVGQRKNRSIMIVVKNSFSTLRTIDSSDITTTTTPLTNTTTTSPTTSTNTFTPCTNTTTTSPITSTTTFTPCTNTTTTSPTTSTNTTTAPTTTACTNTTTTPPTTTTITAAPTPTTTITTTTAPTTTTTTTKTAAPTTTTTTPPTTTNPFSRCFYFQGSCYMIFKECVNYQTAKSRCSDEGAHLAFITSEAEHLFLAGLLQDDSYIGLTDMENEGIFKWDDGSSLNYTRWYESQPDNLGFTDCVVMGVFYNYKWNDVDCQDAKNFICEKRALTTTTNPDTTNPFSRCFNFQGSCYVIFKESVDYTTAMSRCSAEGAHLAFITSEEEHLFLKGLVQADAYIGLTDMENEGIFKWNDGSSLNFTRWRIGEPNDLGGEDCVEMWSFSDYEWNDINCLTAKNFICEKRGSTTAPITTTTTSTTTKPFSRCLNFQGSCYIIFKEFVDYSTAMSRCSAEGAHLAFITSEEEHLFLKGHLDGDAYIGLTDRENEGFFKWNDGSYLTYTRWGTGEPNDLLGEDCVVMWGIIHYEWNDIPCNHAMNFICEKPAQ